MKLEALLQKIKENRWVGKYINIGTFHQFRKYVTTGLMSFCLEMSILFVLTNYLKIWHIYSNTISVVIVFWFNFLLNRYWSFKSRGRLTRQLILYGILFFINIAASNGIMYLLTDIAGVHYLVSKIVSVGMIVVWNFLLYKKVIYK